MVERTVQSISLEQIVYQVKIFLTNVSENQLKVLDRCIDGVRWRSVVVSVSSIVLYMQLCVVRVLDPNKAKEIYP